MPKSKKRQGWVETCKFIFVQFVFETKLVCFFKRGTDKTRSPHQILYATVIKVSATLREAVKEDFDETLVPGGTHG